MPFGAREQVLGGGINPVATFTIGQLLRVTDDSPAEAADSLLRQVAGPPIAIVVGATDPSAAAAETLRTAGGLISRGAAADTTVIGRGAAASVADGIAIGRAASSSGVGVCIGQGASGPGTAIGPLAVTTVNGGGSLAIGQSASCGANAGSDGNVAIGKNSVVGAYARCVAVGEDAQCTQRDTTGLGVSTRAGGFYSVAVGGNAAAGNGGAYDCTAVGWGASCLGQDALAVGYSANASAASGVAVGASAVASHQGAVTLGNGATSVVANGAVLGSGAAPITSVLVGNGNTNVAPSAVTFRLTDSSGVDVAGAAVTYTSGRATGAAASGDILFRSGLVAGTSAVVQALTTRMTINGGTGAVTIAGAFGCNAAAAQAAAASGGAAAATAATNVAPFGYTTAAQADRIVALLNTIRAALVANGIMS